MVEAQDHTRKPSKSGSQNRRSVETYRIYIYICTDFAGGITTTDQRT